MHKYVDVKEATGVCSYSPRATSQSLTCVAERLDLPPPLGAGLSCHLGADAPFLSGGQFAPVLVSCRRHRQHPDEPCEARGGPEHLAGCRVNRRLARFAAVVEASARGGGGCLQSSFGGGLVSGGCERHLPILLVCFAPDRNIDLVRGEPALCRLGSCFAGVVGCVVSSLFLNPIKSVRSSSSLL